MEHMRKLTYTTPESHTQLLAGKFVVMRNFGVTKYFSVVGADIHVPRANNKPAIEN